MNTNDWCRSTLAASRAHAQLQGAAEEAAQDLQARIAAAEAAVAEAEEAAAEAAELQNDAAKAARVASGHAEDAGTQSEIAVKVCSTCCSMHCGLLSNVSAIYNLTYQQHFVGLCLCLFILSCTGSSMQTV